MMIEMTMKLLRQLLICTVLFSVSIVNAQLNNFTLQLSKTNETCPGNGSLTFSAVNTSQGASMLYKVFRLPDNSTPIAIQQGNYLGSLSAATYRVIAIQTLGDLQNSQQKDIAILNNIGSFNFTVSSTNNSCAQGANIIVTATVGIASQYEIIAGPVTRPLQNSNIFTNMPSGSYNIRVFNDCGEGKVKSYTLNLIDASLNISGTTYPPMANPVCDYITVSNTITPTAGTISYPLTVTHTLNPMDAGGNPTVINNVYQTGNPQSLEVTALVPRFLTESYGYEISVTDNCTATYTKNDNRVEAEIELALTQGSALCGEKYLIVTPSKHKAPYTLVVTGPEGFNAADFNVQNEGPFYTTSVNYGSEQNTIPFGIYTVTITDACGRITTDSIDVKFIPPVPALSGTNNGCFSLFGKVRVSVPQQEIVSITMIGAPDAYNLTEPIDFTQDISSNGTLTLNDLPLGEYTFVFTDNCGNQYQRKVKVPPFVQKDFNTAALPGCAPGLGTLRYRSGNGKLVSARIMEVQGGTFNEPLPYDVTQYIADNGNLYMDNLPQGTYIIEGTDICDIVEQRPVNVEGYVINADIFTYTPRCGGFTVKVTDNGNGTEGASYWLQKYNAATNTWGHPNGNNNPYTEGEAPTTSNAVQLTNNVTRNNLNYSGTFRVIKKFETFTAGNKENTICVSQLGQSFEYKEGFKINNAYTLACLGKPNDIYLDVLGYPVAYRIKKKNGVTFVVENGTSNIFTNLEPAKYIFEIEDICGNIFRKEVNIETLPSITDATKPADMLVCNEPGMSSDNYVFHLTDQNEAVLGDLYSASYTITYHLTEEDANSGNNPLPEYYSTTTNGQTIYVRMIHNEINLCHDVESFNLYIGDKPEFNVTVSGIICDDKKVQLTVDKPSSGYLWSTGETTRSILVSEAGSYTVTVNKDYGNRYCSSDPVTVIVEGSVTPEIAKIETTDWTQDQNTITVITANTGDFEYSIDGINYQKDNVFTNLKTGAYKVFVKDAKGCGMDMKDVVLMYYPNYFTPNNDGHHDTWRIPYSVLEPNLTIDLFDRYGKHITTLNATSEGWDGTMNGQHLPSTDYWFVVNREDGRQLKGHFAMIR